MKKNVIANFLTHKHAEKKVLKRLDILPRLLCLLLALIIWLLVVNFQPVHPKDREDDLAGITEVVP